jgi:heptosyltransferase-1
VNAASAAAARTGPRYLLVRLGSLGDVIHAMPAAAALRAAQPDAQVDWLVDPRYVDVVRLVRGVDRAIAVDPRGPKGRLLSVIRDLRRTRYDAAFDVQGLIKSAVLARLSGAKAVLGFPRAHLREAAARFCYSSTPDLGDAEHVVRKALRLVGAVVGGGEAPPVFPVGIPSSAAAGQVAARMPQGFAVLNPGGAWPNKQWPPERFGAVAARLRAERGLPSVVIWGPGEEPLAQRVVQRSGGAAEMSPPTRVLDLFALARAARLVVSGDTGPLHVACAVGTPTVALFGPTIAERNGPWDPRDVVIARTSQCECLYQRQCRRADRCIDLIDVGEVAQAVGRRLDVARG